MNLSHLVAHWIRANNLCMLYLSGHAPQAFRLTQGRITSITPAQGLRSTLDLLPLFQQSGDLPWVILVDQSEEVFWGDVMPPLHGKARRVWLDRIKAKSTLETPYLWAQLQGKSRSQENKRRVLAYALGGAKHISPWLDTLKQNNKRIRGLYSPAQLTLQAWQFLKLPRWVSETRGKKKNKDTFIQVLISPHPLGLRQCVLIDGYLRFARLALRPDSSDAHWIAGVYEETNKLREYMLTNGLISHDRVRLQVHCVIPPHLDPALSHGGIEPLLPYSQDRFDWHVLSGTAPLYVQALASAQPWYQLAPKHYRQRDLAAQVALAIRVLGYIGFGLCLCWGLLSAWHLWGRSEQLSALKTQAAQASLQYQQIAKDFPPSALSAAQLLEMRGNWERWQKTMPPDMRVAMAFIGQTLERYPQIMLTNLEWAMPEVLTANSTATAGASNSDASSLDPNNTSTSKDIVLVTLSGSIKGLASEDLRGARDTMTRLQADFNRNPKFHAEVSKMPLDLSTSASVQGSGTQAQSELNFEVKVWQR